MIAKVKSNRVRRTYLGGARIDAFTGCEPPVGDAPCPEDWMASTVTAFNGTREIPGEGLGRLEDGRLVRDVIGGLPILVKMLDADERLVIQAHPTVSFARARMNSPVGKTECWYFLPGTTPDACVYLGFREGITREAWRDAFARQEGLLDWLHRIPVRAGDFESGVQIPFRVVDVQSARVVEAQNELAVLDSDGLSHRVVFFRRADCSENNGISRLVAADCHKNGDCVNDFFHKGILNFR